MAMSVIFFLYTTMSESVLSVLLRPDTGYYYMYVYITTQNNEKIIPEINQIMLANGAEDLSGARNDQDSIWKVPAHFPFYTTLSDMIDSMLPVGVKISGFRIINNQAIPFCFEGKK